MASQEECLSALLLIAERFNEHELSPKKRERIPDRSVGCTVLDLDVTFRGRLVDGFLRDVAVSPEHSADMRLLCTSEDLIAMVNDELKFAHAWSTGRVRIDASIRDLIKFRSLA